MSRLYVRLTIRDDMADKVKALLNRRGGTDWSALPNLVRAALREYLETHAKELES